MMMLHTRNALGRAGCLLPLYSNSKLCGSGRATNTPVGQYSTSAKDILPTSSPLIDEPVEKIHKQMSKLSAGSNKRLKGMEKFSARLQEMDPKANTPKSSLSLVCYLSFSTFCTQPFSLITPYVYHLLYVHTSLLDISSNLPIVVALRWASYQVTLLPQ